MLPRILTEVVNPSADILNLYTNPSKLNGEKNHVVSGTPVMDAVGRNTRRRYAEVGILRY